MNANATIPDHRWSEYIQLFGYAYVNGFSWPVAWMYTPYAPWNRIGSQMNGISIAMRYGRLSRNSATPLYTSAPLAAKELTEEEYRAQRERLEEEHQRRLNAIREAGNQWGLQAALDGGAAILGAMASSNQKAAKLQAVFASGSALMSAYQGAAKELEKGTFGFATAAAVLAKGIGFATSIMSIGSRTASGSPATASGGASAASAAPAQTPLQVSLTGITPDSLFTGDQIGNLLDRLTEEAGDRGVQFVGMR